MSDYDRAIAQLVADRLAKLALNGPASNREAITADYVSRLELDASLDELIGVGETEHPRLFDPLDPR